MSASKQAIQIARQVRSECDRRHAGSHPLSVIDDILPVIEELSCYSIVLSKFESLRDLETELSLSHDVGRHRGVGSPWWGLLIRRPAQLRASIRFWQGLNRCEKRMVVCKEAAHLVCDQVASAYTSDPHRLVTSLLSGISDLPDEPGWAPIASEVLAREAALEILVPWSQRETLYGMEKDGASHFEIAMHFLVPQKFVARRLSSDYRSKIDGINAILDEEEEEVA